MNKKRLIGYGNRELVLAFIDKRPHQVHGMPHNLCHIDGCFPQNQRTAGKPRNVEQVVYQMGNVIHLTRNGPQPKLHGNRRSQPVPRLAPHCGWGTTGS